MQLADFAFRVPSRSVTIAELWARHAEPLRDLYERVLQIPRLRQVKLEEVESVRVFDGERPGALALEVAQGLLRDNGVAPGQVRLLVDYSTTARAPNGISLAYGLQGELGAHDAITLAVGNGSCVGLQLALETAAAYMQSRADVDVALLFAEDRTQGRRLYAPFNVLGDGASALLLRRGGPGLALLGTRTAAVGRFAPILGMSLPGADNFDFAAFEQKIVPLHYRITQELVAKVLAPHGLRVNDVGLVLYQNMSHNDARGLAGALGIAPERVFLDGLRGHGHVFGSDLVINLCLARGQGLLRPGGHALLVSSGAGFSWGATLLRAPAQAGEAP